MINFPWLHFYRQISQCVSWHPATISYRRTSNPSSENHPSCPIPKTPFDVSRSSRDGIVWNFFFFRTKCRIIFFISLLPVAFKNNCDVRDCARRSTEGRRNSATILFRRVRHGNLRIRLLIKIFSRRIYRYVFNQSETEIANIAAWTIDNRFITTTVGIGEHYSVFYCSKWTCHTRKTVVSFRKFVLYLRYYFSLVTPEVVRVRGF